MAQDVQLLHKLVEIDSFIRPYKIEQRQKKRNHRDQNFFKIYHKISMIINQFENCLHMDLQGL